MENDDDNDDGDDRFDDIIMDYGIGLTMVVVTGGEDRSKGIEHQ